MALDRWILTVELRGGLLAAVSEAPSVAVSDGVVIDVTEAAARIGIVEGMAERAAVLRLPALKRRVPDLAARTELGRTLRRALGCLSDDVRPEGQRGAALTFLPLPEDALRLPWADACSRVVPAHGWCLEGAASTTGWAARLLLRAGRRGAGAIRSVNVAGGRLFLGDWRDLSPTVLPGVSGANQERLRRQRTTTLGQLAALPAAVCRTLVGEEWAARLCDAASEPVTVGGRGVYVAEHRFDPPLGDAATLSAALSLLAAEVAEALREGGEGVRHLVLSVEDEAGEMRRFERECLAPLPAHRLGGAAEGLLLAWSGRAAVARLRLAVEGGAMGWAQVRLLGGRASRPVWSLPGQGDRPVRGSRLRREARLALWDPLRGGGRHVEAR